MLNRIRMSCFILAFSYLDLAYSKPAPSEVRDLPEPPAQNNSPHASPEAFESNKTFPIASALSELSGGWQEGSPKENSTDWEEHDLFIERFLDFIAPKVPDPSGDQDSSLHQPQKRQTIEDQARQGRRNDAKMLNNVIFVDEVGTSYNNNGPLHSVSGQTQPVNADSSRYIRPRLFKTIEEMDEQGMSFHVSPIVDDPVYRAKRITEICLQVCFLIIGEVILNHKQLRSTPWPVIVTVPPPMIEPLLNAIRPEHRGPHHRLGEIAATLYQALVVAASAANLGANPVLRVASPLAATLPRILICTFGLCHADEHLTRIWKNFGNMFARIGEDPTRLARHWQDLPNARQYAPHRTRTGRLLPNGGDQAVPLLRSPQADALELETQLNYGLISSVYSGNLDAFTKAIDRGANANTLDLGVVDRWHNRGTRDMQGCSVLQIAAAKSHIPIVQSLVKKVASIDYYNKDVDGYASMTALILAVKNRHHEVVGILLDNKANPNIKGSRTDLGSIEWAAKNGETEMVQKLINADADVNAYSRMPKPEGSEKWTALHWALHGGHQEIIQKLLDAGADVNATDRTGKTPLFTFLIWNGKSEVTRVSEMIKALKSKGADVNAQDAFGDTALHYVSSHSSRQVFNALIEERANVNVQNYAGETPLMELTFWVGRYRHRENDAAEEIIEKFVRERVLINAADKDGLTALMHAAKHENFVAVELLLKHNAAIDMTDSQGRTALIIAAGQRNPNGVARALETVQVLLEKGANLDIRSNGGTALEVANSPIPNSRGLQIYPELGKAIEAAVETRRIAEERKAKEAQKAQSNAAFEEQQEQTQRE